MTGQAGHGGGGDILVWVSRGQSSCLNWNVVYSGRCSENWEQGPRRRTKGVRADHVSLEIQLTQRPYTRYLSPRSMARQVGQVRPEPAEERRGQR